MTKPEGPAQEPHGKRLMMLPPNPNYPGYVGAHTEDDWCAKAGCIPICVPATPAPSQPAAREPWMEAAMEEIALLYIRSAVTKEQVDGVAVIARHYAQQTASLREANARLAADLDAAERERDSLRAENAALKAGKE